MAAVQQECCAGAGTSDFAEHLVGYWNFEDGQGSQVASDMSGNQRDAQLGSTTGWVDSDLAGGAGAMRSRWPQAACRR